MPIHSVRVDLLFHTGSTRDASNALIASADVMALVPLMGIGLVLPTSLHVMDGLPLRWWGAVFMVLLFLVLLEAFLWRQFSWMKASLLFCLPFFGSFSVDC